MKSNTFSRMARIVAIVFSAILIMSGTLLHAQQPGPGQKKQGMPSPEDRAKRQTTMMKDNLSLTAVQEPKVNDINLKYARKMDEARKITDTAAQRKTVKSLNQQKDNELKAVFTPDQFKTYQKLMEEFKARRGGH